MPDIFETRAAAEQILSAHPASYETLDFTPSPGQPAAGGYRSPNHFVEYEHYCSALPSEDTNPELYATLHARGDTYHRFWRVTGNETEAHVMMTHYQPGSSDDMLRSTRESRNPDRTFKALARLAKILGA